MTNSVSINKDFEEDSFLLYGNYKVKNPANFTPIGVEKKIGDVLLFHTKKI